MQTISQINKTLEDIISLKLVTQAYTEIAAIKLQKIRAGIEKNRNFFQEVSAVFRMVKVAAEKRNIQPNIVKKGSISLLLTSNKRFYGDLENHLTKFFADNTTQFPTDRIVIGTVAKEILEAIKYPYPYQTHIFDDDLPSLEHIRSLLNNLVGYQQILVYYSRMQSVLMQEPSVVDLLQKPPEHYLTSHEHAFDSIFEPEIAKMLEFFDSQIATFLLEQLFLESELARTAARLISMNQAQFNAEDLIRQQKRLLTKADRSLDNIRLLDTIASMTNWRKQNA